MRSPVSRIAAAALAYSALTLPLVSACYAETPAANSAPVSSAVPADNGGIVQPAEGLDLVFCIDCSGSMARPIRRARLAIHALIDEARRTHPEQTIRVGLIRYGNELKRYKCIDFSSDPKEIDKLIDGTAVDPHASEEYVGAFVQMATRQMSWSPAAARNIYIVGNETAAQGPSQLDYRITVRQAAAAGIHVNAIYCSPNTDESAIANRSAQLVQLGRERRLPTAAALSGGTPSILSRMGDNGMMRQIIDDRQTWLTAAYLGYGECMMVNIDDQAPLLERITPNEVAYLVEEVIPGDAQARAIGTFLDRVAQQRASNSIGAGAPIRR